MHQESHTQVSILPATRIDRQQWDACVNNDPGALIYSLSWYLDQMADDWYGLVVNGYQAVLALPVKRIAGIRMVYTPPFFQRLDIAGRYDKAALEQIRKRILAFAPILDCNTADPGLFGTAHLREKTNYILPLDRPYDTIAAAYSKEGRKNIGKAAQRGCVLKHNISIGEVICFYRQAYGTKAAYKEKHFERLTALMERCETQPFVHLMGVADESSRSLIFAAAILDDGRRLYYLLGAPSEEGRKARATAFFIDQMIMQFAGKRAIFDFEGSDLPAVASFYKSFSPETEHYYRFYINRFPQPAKMLLDKLFR